MMRDTVGCITLQWSGRASRAAHRNVIRSEKGAVPMFDLDRFKAECSAAVTERAALQAVREVVARAVEDPKAVLRDRHEISVPDYVIAAGSVSHGWWPKRQFDDGSG